MFYRSKLKAFADDKINVTEKSKFDLVSLENIVGKGENAGFKRLLPQGHQKSSLCGKGLTLYYTILICNYPEKDTF